MRAKYQDYIDSFTYEAAKLMKAIRLTQSLVKYLPGKFPEPDQIRPGRKPDDLNLEWEAANHVHQGELRARVTAALQIFGVKWSTAPDAALICHTRIKLGGKDTMYLRLRIALRGATPQSP